MSGLVIFDCDGVVADSEPIAVAALTAFLNDVGIPIEEGYVYRNFLGRSWGMVTAVLSTDFGLTLTDEHVDRYRSFLFDRIARNVCPIPGVEEALKSLQRPYCLASSSTPERIAVTLRAIGLSARFHPHVFSASEVKRGKPAPDLFLHAATRMGARPEDCLVIEDSPVGLEAARSAGMTAVAFVGGSHVGPGELRPRIADFAPDFILEDMRDLNRLVRSWEERRAAVPQAL